MHEIIYRERRIAYLEALVSGVESKLGRITRNVAELKDQNALLRAIRDEMRVAKEALKIGELFKELQTLKSKIAQKKKKEKKEDYKNPCVHAECFAFCANCDGEIDPISLCEIKVGDGMCADGLCYSKLSLQEMFKHQFNSGQHLHGPVDRAISPEKFEHLAKQGLITKEMMDTLLKRYPIGKFRPVQDLDRRYQLEEVKSNKK